LNRHHTQQGNAAQAGGTTKIFKDEKFFHEQAKYNFEQDSENFQFSVCRIGFTGVITGSTVPL
jgi:hypothetical protein